MLGQWQPFTVNVIIYASAETHNGTHKQYLQRANLCIFRILSHLLPVFMLLG